MSALAAAAISSEAVEPAPLEQWFAVWTRSRCETKVEDGLARKGFEVFLPRIRLASRRRDRRATIDWPLFPGYVFLRFAPSREGYIGAASTEGVVRILGERWDALHALPDAQLEAVRRLVGTEERVRPVPWLANGDRVRIVRGPLAGIEGSIRDSRDGRASFVVSLDLLQRSVAVEVPGEILSRI